MNKKVFQFKNDYFIKIKDHSFYVLNGFYRPNSYGYSHQPIYLQLVSTSKTGGIIKEYLDEGWELQKGKYNNQMIFTIYNKKYFNHGSKSNRRGYLTFIAPTLDACTFLLAKTYLFPQADIEFTNEKFELVKKVILNNCEILQKINDKQTFEGIALQTNNDWDVEWLIRKINEKINLELLRNGKQSS